MDQVIASGGMHESNAGVQGRGHCTRQVDEEAFACMLSHTRATLIDRESTLDSRPIGIWVNKKSLEVISKLHRGRGGQTRGEGDSLDVSRRLQGLQVGHEGLKHYSPLLTTNTSTLTKGGAHRERG
jgi:hypothetical protein